MNPEIAAKVESTLAMFATLATELVLLFLVISFLVGVLQAVLTPEKVKNLLSSKHSKGYFIAALLGFITPFCSCSTIPFLKGLLKARAGFGPLMVFLFASPLISPMIIGLFVYTFGWQVAVFYFLTSVLIATLAGYTIEKLGFERFIKPEVYDFNAAGNSTCSKAVTVPAPQKAILQARVSKSDADNTENVRINCCGDRSATIETIPAPLPNLPILPLKQIWQSTLKDFKQVLPFLLLGVAVGSVVYGFMPTELITTYAGADKWYAIPLAAIIGIPLYIRAEAVIPLSSALVQKGMALGSIMALIIGSAGASITEVILLKSIFKNQVILAFLTVVLGMAVCAGFSYQLLFA